MFRSSISGLILLKLTYGAFVDTATKDITLDDLFKQASHTGLLVTKCDESITFFENLTLSNPPFKDLQILLKELNLFSSNKEKCKYDEKLKSEFLDRMKGILHGTKSKESIDAGTTLPKNLSGEQKHDLLIELFIVERESFLNHEKEWNELEEKKYNEIWALLYKAQEEVFEKQFPFIHALYQKAAEECPENKNCFDMFAVDFDFGQRQCSSLQKIIDEFLAADYYDSVSELLKKSTLEGRDLEKGKRERSISESANPSRRIGSEIMRSLSAPLKIGHQKTIYDSAESYSRLSSNPQYAELMKSLSKKLEEVCKKDQKLAV